MPRKITLPADYPQAVLHQIEQLAHNITVARRRRGESQAQWASKLGVSQPTMVRIERGDPSVAMASYVMCMWLINQADGLADLVAPQKDHTALEREVAKVRLKGKPRKQVPSNERQSKDSAVGSGSAATTERAKLDHSFASHKSLTSTSKLPDLATRTTSPLGGMHGSLERATQLSDLAAPSTASGIAALLASPGRKSK